MQSAKKLWKESWTVLWGHLQVAAGVLLLAAPVVANALNDPNVGGQLPSDWVKYGLIAAGVVTYAARILPHVGEQS